MRTNIRLASAADRDAVEAIVESAYAPYIPRIGRAPAPMVADYRDLIARGRVHVAEFDGVVRGVLVLIRQADTLLLENIAVAPSVRGLGVGRCLLEFAESSAIEAGYRTIKLYTNVAMTENISLYRRIGYVETGRSGESGFRRVDMEKSLS